MKFVNYLFILSGIIISCTSNEMDIPICDVDNPIEELDWLKEIKGSIAYCSCETSIYQALYNGQTVFYIACQSYCCDMGGLTLRDCAGNIVKEIRYIDPDYDKNKVTAVKTLYTCENKFSSH